MTTWGKLEEIDAVHVANLNTWQVSSGSLDHWGLVSINDKGTFAESESGILHLANTSSCSLRLSDSGEIIHGTEVLEVTEKSTGGGSVKTADNKWEFWNRVDLVTTGLDEWGAGRGGESGGNGISFLLSVDLSLPLSPDLEWGKHATLTAHVSESTLA